MIDTLKKHKVLIYKLLQNCHPEARPEFRYAQTAD